MSQDWNLVPLSHIISERQEVPSADALIKGEIWIIEKIGFNDGKIQLRSNTTTKTNMILIQPGDLVVSGINAAKGAIAIFDENNTVPIAATIHYSSYIINKQKADIRYLWWLLRSHKFKELLLEYVPGGIKTELKAKRLLPVPIPLPPLEEQRRIVARVEEIVGKIEEVRSLRQKTLKQTEVLQVVESTKLFSNIPANGQLANVLCGKPKNGWSARCNNMPGGIAVLSLGAITGFSYREKEFKRTSELVSHDANYWLKPGDLLITRSNTPELVGHAAIYNGSPFPCIYPDLMMRLDVDESKVDKKFVHRWLTCTPVRDYIKRKAKGTSPTMKKISQEVVMSIPFPSNLSLPEQRRIVAYLDELQTKVDTMKRLREQAIKELDALLPSILDKAFKGEL